MSDLKLLRGRVLVRVTGDSAGYAHEFARAGLVMPDSAKFDPRKERNQNSLGRGVVMSYGPPMVTKRGAEVERGFDVGDEVLFIGQHHSRSLTLGGEVYHAIGQEEVVAVIGAAS